MLHKEQPVNQVVDTQDTDVCEERRLIPSQRRASEAQTLMMDLRECSYNKTGDHQNWTMQRCTVRRMRTGHYGLYDHHNDLLGSLVFWSSCGCYFHTYHLNTAAEKVHPFVLTVFPNSSGRSLERNCFALLQNYISACWIVSNWICIQGLNCIQ